MDLDGNEKNTFIENVRDVLLTIDGKMEGVVTTYQQVSAELGAYVVAKKEKEAMRRMARNALLLRAEEEVDAEREKKQASRMVGRALLMKAKEVSPGPGMLMGEVEEMGPDN
jgi:hypothetical protein